MQPQTNRTLLFGILFLFFLQVLSDFIQSIYSFGLLMTGFPAEIVSIVLLFTPLLLLFFRRPPSRTFLVSLAFIAIVARLLEPMLDPGGRLVLSGISVGTFMLLFPSLLSVGTVTRGWSLAGGLALAVIFSTLFRAASSSLDVSQYGMFQLVAWLLGLLALYLFWSADWSASEPGDTGAPASSSGRVVGLSMGLAAVITLLYFAFTSPAVIARWTGFSYPLVVTSLALAFILFSLLINLQRFVDWLDRRSVLLWNLLFILFLVLSILPHQVSLPADASLYPIDAPPASPLAVIPLVIMLLLSPVLFIDFMLLARSLSAGRPSIRQLGGGFALAALFFLLMVFFHIFTTIYDYAPVVGPLFRDRFWLVYLLAGLGVFLPLLLLPAPSFKPGLPSDIWPFTPLRVAGLAAFILISVILTAARPAAPADVDALKIMTYNIQQGFDEQGSHALNDQLAVIRSVDPHILGLQESDTARIANGNVDLVRFMADRLNMYSYYGPSTTTGTFGIALLSKYPIQNPRTFFMFSEGEQTAAIHAGISVSGRSWNVFVTHLGNSGPIVQLENMLVKIEGQENVIAMGDFNFRPPTEQYALMTASLDDSWLLRWPGGKEIPGYSPDKRIDHIFVSPGTVVLDSEYNLDPASDHPYMWTVIQP